MNLLYTSTAYSPSTGGAQLHHHMLAAHLAVHHSVRSLSFWDENRTDWLLGTTLRVPATDRQYMVDGVPVQLMGLSTPEKLRILPFVLTYYAWIGKASYRIAAVLQDHIEPHTHDVSLIHNVRIGREPLSIASLAAARKQDVPFVLTTVHHPRWHGWRYRTYDALYRQADALIALTHAEKEILLDKGVQEERIYVHGMGPVLAEDAVPADFLEKYSIQNPFILFLGQHYLYKGYQQLLQASQKIFKRMPEANIVFIGPKVGDSDRYFAEFGDPRIRHLGKVSLEDKTNALAACDLLCVPSTQESFGGVYTEAWSFGKPVIGCKIPAVSEIIEDGVNGYLVDQHPQEIADRSLDLLLHPERSAQLGEAGRRKVQQRYTWERLAEQMEQIYLAVLG